MDFDLTIQKLLSLVRRNVSDVHNIRQVRYELAEMFGAEWERNAIQAESRNAEIALTTTGQRAIEALQRPESVRGEHDAARAWLREYEPHLGIFRKGSAA